MLRAVSCTLALALLAAGTRASAAPQGRASGASYGKPASEAFTQRFDPTQDIGIDQRLGERLPMDALFTDSEGRQVRLGDLFGDRPVVLALVYYECPMLCTLILNGMLRVFRGMSLGIGEDFDVITVSIDPRETPALAAAKRDNLLEEYAVGAQRPAAAQGWHALVGQQQSIDALAAAVGFRYVYDAEQDEYAHASGLMVATPAGVLSRYLYGIEFVPRDLRLSLVEAADGGVGSLTDQLLLLCFHYDPTQGAYGLAITRVLKMGGLLTLLVLGVFMASSLRAERRANRSDPTASES